MINELGVISHEEAAVILDRANRGISAINELTDISNIMENSEGLTATELQLANASVNNIVSSVEGLTPVAVAMEAEHTGLIGFIQRTIRRIVEFIKKSIKWVLSVLGFQFDKDKRDQKKKEAELKKLEADIARLERTSKDPNPVPDTSFVNSEVVKNLLCYLDGPLDKMLFIKELQSLAAFNENLYRYIDLLNADMINYLEYMAQWVRNIKEEVVGENEEDRADRIMYEPATMVVKSLANSDDFLRNILYDIDGVGLKKIQDENKTYPLDISKIKLNDTALVKKVPHTNGFYVSRPLIKGNCLVAYDVYIPEYGEVTTMLRTQLVQGLVSQKPVNLVFPTMDLGSLKDLIIYFKEALKASTMRFNAFENLKETNEKLIEAAESAMKESLKIKPGNGAAVSKEELTLINNIVPRMTTLLGRHQVEMKYTAASANDALTAYQLLLGLYLEELELTAGLKKG